MPPAIVVPPPPRFSTTIGCPSCADNGSKTTRGMTSVALPAAKAMIAWIGLLGQVWATASLPHPSSKAATTSNQRGMQHSLLACPWQEGSKDRAAGEGPGSLFKITPPRRRSGARRVEKRQQLRQ